MITISDFKIELLYIENKKLLETSTLRSAWEESH